MVTKVGEQHWFVCIVKRACKHSRQIMSSVLAAESTLRWEDAKCIHVFAQKCGVIKLVSFSDVVQEMPHCSTLAMFGL